MTRFGWGRGGGGGGTSRPFVKEEISTSSAGNFCCVAVFTNSPTLRVCVRWVQSTAAFTLVLVYFRLSFINCLLGYKIQTTLSFSGLQSCLVCAYLSNHGFHDCCEASSERDKGMYKRIPIEKEKEEDRCPADVHFPQT